jgi:hypothetical protein
MSKVLSYSLLGFGGLIVAYPFLKKEKKIQTTEEILLSKDNPNFCDNINLKKNMLFAQRQDIQNNITKLREDVLTKKISEEEGSKKTALLYKSLIEKDKEIELNKTQVEGCSKNTEECLRIDANIKRQQDNISDYSADLLKPLKERKNKYNDKIIKGWLNTSKNDLLRLNNEFVDKDCRNNIEKLRIDETGFILTKQSEKTEKNVSPKNEVEQYIYISLGSLVLLTGLYLISKK